MRFHQEGVKQFCHYKAVQGSWNTVVSMGTKDETHPINGQWLACEHIRGNRGEWILTIMHVTRGYLELYY